MSRVVADEQTVITEGVFRHAYTGQTLLGRRFTGGDELDPTVWYLAEYQALVVWRMTPDGLIEGEDIYAAEPPRVIRRLARRGAAASRTCQPGLRTCTTSAGSSIPRLREGSGRVPPPSRSRPSYGRTVTGKLSAVLSAGSASRYATMVATALNVTFVAAASSAVNV